MSERIFLIVLVVYFSLATALFLREAVVEKITESVGWTANDAGATLFFLFGVCALLFTVDLDFFPLLEVVLYKPVDETTATDFYLIFVATVIVVILSIGLSGFVTSRIARRCRRPMKQWLA